MKRFFTLFLIMIVGVLGSDYARYYKGFYIQREREAPIAYTRTDGKQVMRRAADGSYQPLEVRGVLLTSSLPGHYVTDFAVDQETYLRWFGQMQEMGANTVRVSQIMDAKFYEALATYNTRAASPLYLLQGIAVSGDVGNNGEDAYQEGFYRELMDQATKAVDVIHGNRNILLGQEKGSGIYRKDVSEWVLGYVIGNTWNPDTVAYTNHRGYPAQFEGTYLQTTAEATAFEALLAQVLDQLITYETNKYGAQRLVAFDNEPLTDPFEYDPYYAKQLGKHTQLDAEHLVAGPAFEGGYFASYMVYDLYPEFYTYFSEAQKQRLPELGQLVGPDLSFEGYSNLLNAHHTLPVLAQYGYSASRGVAKGQPLTEQAQGEALVAGYEDLMASGCAGVVISSWQDQWGQPAWNTAYGVLREDARYWHDLQAYTQGSGLMSFEPGALDEAGYIDGLVDEWEGIAPVVTQDGMQLSLRENPEGLYILIEGIEAVRDRPLYIPIDVTPQSGRPSDGADFLLVLDGTDQSRLLVHERYEALRANYGSETKGINAYAHSPDAHSDAFVPIEMMVGTRQLIAPNATGEYVREQTAYQVWETGRLRYGTANPAHADFDSLADYCYGEGLVEVRLPWQLLNFMSPHKTKVHDDYYVHYGVEPLRITSIGIGIGTVREGSAEESLTRVPLEGWRERLVYHERLKASYEKLQAVWQQGGDRDGR